MKHPFLVAALGVLVVSNAFVLVHAAINRSGSPDAELELTPRELSYNYGADSMASLALHWEVEPGLPGWFDERKLKEAGFDVSVSPDSKDAVRHYQNGPSREVFVALEFDGPAWQRLLQQREENVRAQARENAAVQIEQIQRANSRLVAVDVSLDPEALRRKYPDRTRVMILRGQARVVLESGGSPAYLRGVISQILDQSLSVPAQFRDVFTTGAYAVTLRVGRRYEPWIADVKTVR